MQLLGWVLFSFYHFVVVSGLGILQLKVARSSSSSRFLFVGRISPRFERVTTAASNDDSAEDQSFHDVSNHDDHDDEYMHISTKIPTASSPYWELGNSFEQFLNQCTIQSFLFLLKTCRDPQTVLWVEDFTEPTIDSSATLSALPGVPPGAGAGSYNSKLLSYHGLAAMNTTKFPSWQDYFTELLQCPPLEYRVVSSAAHIPDYDHEIHPPRLCMRMIAVREQIAREFVKDLQVIAAQNAPPSATTTTTTSSQPPQSRMQGADFLFLEFAPDLDSDYAPSPLRKGNFDLLVLLTTQESIHRLLNAGGPETVDFDNDSNEKGDNEISLLSSSQRSFLSNFYLHRLVSHFTGAQRYNRAQEFLQELSSMDPTIVAQIFRQRSRVALEWRDVASSVPDAHVNIQKLIFQRLLPSYQAEEDAFQ